MSANERGSWSTRIGFILAASGSAIGLGNIWKFPFTAGQNGGALFVFVYLGAVLFVALPILMAEIALGRGSRRNPVGAFEGFGARGGWMAPGWMGVASGFLILAFYVVVAGWAMEFLYLSLSRGLAASTAEEVPALFETLVGNGARQILWAALFMAATVVIVAGGIASGIERASRIMMPALFLMLLGLMVYALTLPGAGQAVSFLLAPRLESFSGAAVLAAMGQAFFSLSLGMGAMITYGSYLDDRANIGRSALWVALSDTSIALLAGLVIFPVVFTFGLDPGSGPGLIFQTLPLALNQLPATTLIGTTFFLLLLFAALTSAISLLEVVVAYCVDELGWSRLRAAGTAGGAIFLVSLVCALDSGAIDRLDFVTSNLLLPLGGLLIGLFAGWKLSTREQEQQLGTGPLVTLWRWMVRVVSPIAVAIVFLFGLLG